MPDTDGSVLLNGALHGGKVVVAVFSADYCPYCTSFTPTFEKYARENPEFRFIRVDIADDDSPLWNRYHIEVVPILIGFKNGREVGRRDGVKGVGLSGEDLKSLIAELKVQSKLGL